MVILKGPSFSPAVVEKHLGVSFVSKVEPGGSQGSSPEGVETSLYGSGILECAHIMTNWCNDRALLAWLAFVKQSLDEFRRAGATEIVLHFDVGYRSQGNFETDEETLNALADLGIPMTVKFYWDESIELEDYSTIEWNKDAEDFDDEGSKSK